MKDQSMLSLPRRHFYQVTQRLRLEDHVISCLTQPFNFSHGAALHFQYGTPSFSVIINQSDYLFICLLRNRPPGMNDKLKLMPNTPLHLV